MHLKNLKRAALAAFVLLLLAAPVLSAQAVFDSREWDFGAIREADGAVRHAFQVFNSGSKTLRLERAIPGCSCIWALLPKGDIAPGEGAVVEVVFTPAGAAGTVQRSVEIYASGNRSLGMLNISADVLPASRSIQERYPVVLADGLYASRAGINFGYLERGKETGKAFFIANASEKPVQLTVSGIAAPFRVVCPSSLEPGEEARVEVWCDTPADPSLFATFRASLQLVPKGGAALRELPLSGLCLTAAPETEDAPRLRTNSLKLSKGFLSRTHKGTLEISNDGASELILHQLELPEGLHCPVFRRETHIGPGKSLKLDISGKAAPDARLTLFSNDPLRPSKEILIQTI